MKKTLLITALLFTCNLVKAQCKPKMPKQANGDIVKLYGGKIKNGGFGNDKSHYSLYIAQNEDGKKGTSLVAVFYEHLKNKKQYTEAVNNFLNENNLQTSTLEIRLNGESIKFKPTECTQKPTKLLGDIIAYNVFFESDITKYQIKQLQKHDIQKFRLVIGGHPFEKLFKKPNKKTEKLKNQFSCINMNNVFELKKKNADEMDLSEVSISNYSNTIEGNWNIQGTNGKVIDFSKGKITYKKQGIETNKGTYKIAGNRLISTSSEGNKVMEISMFLKDMLILKSNGKEETLERVN